MNNSKALFQYLLSGITLQESQGEIESIVYIILEHYFKVTHTDILLNKPIMVSQEEMSALDNIVRRINNHEPVQYITGESFFFRRKFSVNSAVLIPRPETEELILEVIGFAKRKGLHDCRILDLGTGSGCIPITLALEMPKAKVMATDISQQALEVAKANTSLHNVMVDFYLHDMLSDALTLTDLDVVTSNPPYITEREKEFMHENVLAYEPHLALFVPDNDPLKFYKVIAEKSWNALKAGGLLVVEVNEHFGHATAEVFAQRGYTKIEICYDLSQKQRIVKGIKS